MKKGILQSILVLILFFPIMVKAQQTSGKLKMWYDKPASVWNEALPIGNGRLGAMIFGAPAAEKIQLNEGTFWSGGPSRNDNTDALAALPTIRQLIADGKYSDAETMINQKVIAKQNHGSVYQPIGYLNLSFTGHSTYTNYYRELDLENAKFTTTYKVGDVIYKREVFASQPDQVIVVRLSASQAGKLTFTANLTGSLSTASKPLDATTLEMKGLSSTHEGVTGQVKFDTRVKIINIDGTTASSSTAIKVTNATEVLLLISTATNFTDYKTLSTNEIEKCSNFLTNASAKSYAELESAHISAYQNLFKRVNFDLGISGLSGYSIDVRVKNFSKTKDPELVALYYQFGRYLLISASQPGGQPATLQGLWNDQTAPSWDSKYTININTEMNYWPAEKCNMPEMHEPLIQMVKELSEAGKQTASSMYGCDGWVTHHNTDIWRICGPVDGAFWGMWAMGGAWLSQHLWEKYMYNGDLNYLESIYPVLKSACQFYQDFLVEEPTHKWLIVSPAISPENAAAGRSTSVCSGTTMDNQILFDLFSKTIKAASLLNKNDADIADFQAILDRLPPMQIGRFGQLQEWMEDLDNPDDQHRHVSHLYGLFPSNQISPYSQPKLFDAAKTTLIHRGDVSTGWSMGWKVNFWARLLDGNHALKLITDQLTLVDPVAGSTGGTYPNLFDAHPPFQIDGNFGCTSGITEMLLQSHDGAIHILPALPDAWKNGEISGLRTYGGFEVSFVWENGQVQKVIVKSNLGGNCRLRLPNEVAFIDGTLLNPANGENSNPFFAKVSVKEPLISSSAQLNELNLNSTLLYDLPTEAGKTYTLVCIKNPVFQYASVENSNPKQIIVKVKGEIKKTGKFTGFSVKVDNQVTEIDSVVAGETSNELLIFLKNNITNANEVKVSYNNGNVLSIFNTNLENFTDTLVINMLTGTSPRIKGIKTSEDGLKINVKFNMKMQLPSVFSGFSLNAEYNGNKSFTATQVALTENDSTIEFTLNDKVFADYLLTVNYSGNSVKTVDNGILKAVENFPVENFAQGLPPQIISGKVEADGITCTLTFSKPLTSVLGQETYFNVKLNSNSLDISNMSIFGSQISFQLASKVRYGNSVKVSYTPGAIVAEDEGVLASFSDFELSNSIEEPAWIIIPGKVEAESYFAQSGIQTETTGDEGGGLNVGWIDANDWMEYAVNNTSTDSIFTVDVRLASWGSGIIEIFIDEISIGTVSAVYTGGWQSYQSVYKELKIKPGKHIMKLIAKESGFNLNYLEFKKNANNRINIINSIDLNVFPNPANDFISVKLENKLGKKVSYIILDISGRKITNGILSSEKTIKLNNCVNGVYILKLLDSEQILTKKFTIKR